VQADDYGCFQAHPAIIRANGYGLLLDKVTTLQSKNWTTALAKENIIHLYEANGKPYGHFVNWAKYQQIRAQRRKWPEPSCDITCNQVKSDVLGNPNPNPNPNPKRRRASLAWEPEDWFKPLMELQDYKAGNRRQAAKKIQEACTLENVLIGDVVKAFCIYWPIGRLKHDNWHEPVACLLRTIDIQIAKTKGGNGRDPRGQLPKDFKEYAEVRDAATW